MQTKKLMTLVKSKYFMLKANFPNQAKLIDEQPILDNHEPETDFTFGARNQDSLTDSKGEHQSESQVKTQSMMKDPKHSLHIEEDSEADRQAQYKKDKDATVKRDQETEMLLKQLENIKKIDKLVEETKHADRFKNIKYIDRGE